MKKILLFVLSLITVFSLAACSELSQSADHSDAISFRRTDFSRADRIVIRNLHNGRETELQNSEDIQEIAKTLRSIRGDGKESQQGTYGGIYELKVYCGNDMFFDIAFGDDASFAYGDYGDGYPCRYRLVGKTTQELTDFFAVYDSSISGNSKLPA